MLLSELLPIQIDLSSPASGEYGFDATAALPKKGNAGQDLHGNAGWRPQGLATLD